MFWTKKTDLYIDLNALSLELKKIQAEVQHALTIISSRVGALELDVSKLQLHVKNIRGTVNRKNFEDREEEAKKDPPQELKDRQYY